LSAFEILPKLFWGENRVSVFLKHFSQSERVQMVKMIPPQQGITSALIDIEPSTTCNQYFNIFRGRIVEALEKSLPPRVLVNFVQTDTALSPWGKRCGSFPKIFRVLNDSLTVTFNVPIEIERRCLANVVLPTCLGPATKAILASSAKKRVISGARYRIDVISIRL
jgi:hypothetical protein